MKKKATRTRAMNISLTQEEYALLQKRFKETTFQVFSEYIRAVLFNKRIVTTYRNRSLDEFLSIAGPMKSTFDERKLGIRSIYTVYRAYRKNWHGPGIPLQTHKSIRQIVNISNATV